jgi:site-specific DNA-methyltransferase (adenine-specific)
VAENVLEHGTGGINIDGCRVGNEGYTIGGKNKSVAFGSDMEKQERCDGSLGRFPANVMHDGSEVVLEIFPQTSKSSGGSGISSQKSATGEIYGEYKQGHKSQNLGGLGDEGTASRYFYCAKASKDDRDEGLEQQEAPTENLQGLDTRGRTLVREDGSKTLVERWKPNQTRKNTHPTVKPVELMKYLCRLVTPQGGVVLDPFMGSGSTGVAAMKEGFKFVGIELDRDYFDMACARIEEAQHNIQQDLF